MNTNRLTKVAVVGALGLVVAACGDDSSDGAVSRDSGMVAGGVPTSPVDTLETDAMYGDCEAHADEDMDYAQSLAQLANSSDISFLGRVVDSTDEIVSYEEGIDVGYRTFAVEVIMVLSGSDALGEMVDVVMEISNNGCHLMIGNRPIPSTDERAIWFVDEIDPEFGPLGDYVLSTSQGIMVEVDDSSGRAVDHVEWLAYYHEGVDGITEELSSMESIDELAEYIAGQ